MMGCLYLMFKVISTNDYDPDCYLFIYLGFHYIAQFSFELMAYCPGLTNTGIDYIHHQSWSLKHLYPCRAESTRPLHAPLLIQFPPPLRMEPGGLCSLHSSQFLGNQGVSSVLSACICPLHKVHLVPTRLAGPSWRS